MNLKKVYCIIWVSLSRSTISKNGERETKKDDEANYFQVYLLLAHYKVSIFCCCSNIILLVYKKLRTLPKSMHNERWKTRLRSRRAYKSSLTCSRCKRRLYTNIRRQWFLNVKKSCHLTWKMEKNKIQFVSCFSFVSSYVIHFIKKKYKVVKKWAACKMSRFHCYEIIVMK